VAIAQPILWGLWKFLPAHNRIADVSKLAAFLAVLGIVGHLSRRGVLPRTRPIVPGELAILD